jgi:hypothetical protein
VSGFLGLDPERVSMLRLALDDAVDALRALRCDDPVAHEPLVAVRRVAESLDEWARRCAALTDCAVLTGYRRVHPDRDDLRLAALSTWTVGDRQVWSDPLGPPGTVAGVDPAVEATAVGARLRTGALHELLDANGLGWLIERLGRWRHDPAARAAFMDGLGTAGLDRLADEDPHAAARLLASLDLVPPRLAQMAERVLRSWVVDDPAWYLDAPGHELSVADLVLGAVLAEPIAAISLFDAMSDRLDVLLFGANDPAAGRRLVAAVTDPGHATVNDAGRRLRAVVELMQADPIRACPDLTTVALELRLIAPVGIDAVAREREIRAWLGSVVAPWQPWFTGAATEWGWQATDGLRALVFVADDDASAAALGDGLGPALARLVATAPSQGPGMRAAIDAAAFTSGAVAEILRDAEVDDLAERRALWGLAHSGLDAAAAAGTRALTAPLPPPVPMLVRRAVGLGLGVAIDAVDGDARDESRRAARREMARRVATAHLLVGVLAERARREGRLPGRLGPVPAIDLDDPTALVHPAALERLHAWIHSPGMPAELRLELQHAVLAVANSADLGDLAATLADS